VLTPTSQRCLRYMLASCDSFHESIPSVLTRVCRIFQILRAFPAIAARCTRRQVIYVAQSAPLMCMRQLHFVSSVPLHRARKQFTSCRNIKPVFRRPSTGVATSVTPPMNPGCCTCMILSLTILGQPCRSDLCRYQVHTSMLKARCGLGVIQSCGFLGRGASRYSALLKKSDGVVIANACPSMVSAS
jgi:hypothetical protein